MTVQTLPTPVKTTDDIASIAAVLLLWLFWGLMIFAVAMFLVGGYFYATSRGEPEKIQTANKTLLYATIAVVIALVAQGIPFVISSFFKLSGGY